MTQHRTPRPINTQEAAIDKLQAEVQRLRDRIKELEETIGDELTVAKAAWANVSNHPASKHAKDVRFYEELLKGDNP